MPEILTESFCERCGTRYTFESARQRVRLKGVKVLSRGLKNFVLSDSTSIDEAMASARAETDRQVTTNQLDAFHQTFSFCLSCRQYTCSNCWNTVEARCLSCAPEVSDDGLAAAARPTSATPQAGVTGPAVVQATNGSNGHSAGPGTVIAAGATFQVLTEAAAGGVIEPVEVEPTAAAKSSAASEVHPKPVVAGLAAAASARPAAHATTPRKTADVRARSAAQTTALLRRFRPGQNIDAELDAYEQGRTSSSAAAAAAVDQPVTAEQRLIVEPVAADAPAAPEPVAQPVAADHPAVAVAIAAAEPVADAQPVAAEQHVRPAAALSEHQRAGAVPAAAAVAPETEPVAAQPQPAREPLAAAATVAPEPDPVPAAAAPAATAAPPTAEPTPPPAPPATVRATPPRTAFGRRTAARSDPAPQPPVEDLVVQPTWQRVAPDVQPDHQPVAPSTRVTPSTPVPSPASAAKPTPGAAAIAAAAASRTPEDQAPQWPAQPEWPVSTTAKGLPFLNRPPVPESGMEGLWAASIREVVTTPRVPGKPANAVQPCLSCGLSLSANARFCRRCGASQV
jgi:hypothetical protein